MEPLFLAANSFVEAFDDLVRRMRNRRRSLDSKTVVIVPDKYTLYTEKLLFAGGGAFDVEVVTFSRLLSKTGFRPKNTISRFGSVMLLKKLIGDGKELKCFHRSARFTGFAGKMYDTIAQLTASGVTPKTEIDCEDGALKAKMDDVRLLQRKYDDATNGVYTDSSALLAALPSALAKSGYLAGAQVYILNFDRFTAVQKQAITAICAQASFVGVYEVKERTDPAFGFSKKIEIYPAPDYASALKAVAARIRFETVKNGARFSDFCVVTANPDSRTVMRIFSEYKIVFAVDDKYPLMSHPLSRYLLAALDASDNRFSRDKLVRLAKCIASGIKPLDAAEFENVCNGRRIDYKGFLKPIEDNEIAEGVRKKVLDTVLPLCSRLKPYMKAEDFVAAVKEVTAKAENPKNAHTDYELENFASALSEVVDLMSSVMCGGEYPLDILVSTLKEGIDSQGLSYLPTSADCVAVGQPALFRGQKFRKIFVVGFDDGVLPIASDDCGVITDGEIDKLWQVGAKVEPKIAEVNARSRSELLHLLASCDDLFLSHTSSLAQSSLLALIIQNNRTEQTGYARERGILSYDKDDAEKEELLFKNACCEAAAKELVLEGLESDDAPYASTVAMALGRRADSLFSERNDDYILGRGRNIFFRKKTAYISQIQTFFTCPYRHFLEYGLMLKEREDGTVSPKDVGIILHRIAELFTKRGDYSAPETAAQEIFAFLLNGEMSDYAALKQSALDRILGESKRLCRTIAEQFVGSDYTCLGEEVRFSHAADARFKTPEIKLRSGGTLGLVGVVDRIDVCGNRARIIDYKTGYIDGALAPAKLYYGLKIQLELYAEVLKNNGYDISGMFYFPVGNDWTDNAEYCRMNGVFDSSPESVTQMDKALIRGEKSRLFNVRTRIKKDGTLALWANNPNALSKEDISAMCDYAKDVFLSAVEDIDDGFITPLPYVEARNSACEYCPYVSVCAVQNEHERRVLGKITARAVTGGKEGD